MAKIKNTMTVSLEEIGKKAGEYSLDEFEYKGLTIRQWADKITSGEYQLVKHGEWIDKKVSRIKWIPYADDDANPDDVDIECMTEQKCSYCKRWTIKFTYHIELDYCPLCGARMDGDSDE